jgi:hypothetical protein
MDDTRAAGRCIGEDVCGEVPTEAWVLPARDPACRRVLLL